MKIEAGFLQPTIRAGGDSSPEVSQKHGFQSVLRNTCVAENGLNAGEICETGRSSEVTEKEKIAVLRAEKVLDMLDIYREKLADVKTPLDDIRPLIGDIEQAAGHLERALHRLQPGTGASEITREIGALAFRQIRAYNSNTFSGLEHP